MLSLVIVLCAVISALCQTPERWGEPECGISQYPDAGRQDVDHDIFSCIKSPTNRDKRVTDGCPSRRGEFPWVVSISSNGGDTHGCNGFIIDRQWIASAQHCYNAGTDPRSLTISVRNYYNNPADGDKYVPLRAVFHPNYDTVTYENDIVMFKLGVNLTWANDSRPLCAPQENDYFGRDAWLAGWGNQYEGGPPSDDLLHAKLVIINNTDCYNRVDENHKRMIFPSSICHRSPTPISITGNGRDAGDGDSGGVIAIKDSNNRFRATGIQSWGYWPAGEEKPSVCTRLSMFLDYIDQVRRDN